MNAEFPCDGRNATGRLAATPSTAAADPHPSSA
jgi:hypothetical protein